MDDKRPSKRSSRLDKEPSASSSSATLEANDDPVPPKRPASTRVSARSDAKASGRTSARGPAAGGGGGNSMSRMAARRAARRKRKEEEAARLAAEAARPLSASELVQRMSQESAKKKQEREDAKIREEEEAIEKAEREAEEKEAAEEAKLKAEEQAAKKAEAEAKRAERAAQKAAAAESGEGEAVEELDEEPKRRFKLHWSLKIVAFLMLVFLGYLGFLWATTGHMPALHTEEGRDELVRDVKEDWATLTAFSKVSARDLDKYLEGKPPETKEQIAALVDESKEDLASAGSHTVAAHEEHEKPAAPKSDASHVDVGTLRKAPTDKKVSPYGNTSSNTTASRPAAPRSGSGSNRGVKVDDPRLATARDIYQKAIALYVHADPRSADAATVQKYLKQAKPLFEQVLDECDKASAKGANNGELDRLQRDAAMRLYDCNKRTTL